MAGALAQSSQWGSTPQCVKVLTQTSNGATYVTPELL